MLAILTLTGGCAAVSAAMSATVTVRRPQVERHLAVARLAAGRADLLERGLDLACDPMLRVELEAEKAARRDDDRGDQADQDLYHSVSSGC